MASLAALGLAGCVSYTSSDTIMALPSARAVNASIGEVVLTGAPNTVSPEFASLFQREVAGRMNQCAGGAQPLRMEVRVIELQTANAVLTIVAGDSNVIRAQVALVEPSTGQKVADYDVSRSVGGGGLASAIGLAEGEKMMSRELATDICERAFGENAARRRSNTRR